MVSLGEDATIKVWDAESGKLIRTVTGLLDKNDFVQDAIALSKDGRSVFSHSFEAIRRIDVRSGTLQKKFPKVSTFAQWLSFGVSSDDRYIAAAHSGAVNASLKNSGIGSQVKLLDAESGRVIRTLGTYSEKESPTSIVFSPDGRLVAVGGYEGIAKIWDVASGRLLYTLAHSETRNSRSVNQVGFTPDSRAIVTAGGPEGLKFWDATTGQMVRKLNDKRYAWSGTFAFSANGRFMLSAASQAISVTDVAGTLTATSVGQADTQSATYAPLASDRWLEIGPHGMGTWDAASGQFAQSYEREPGYIAGSARFWGLDGNGRLEVALHGSSEQPRIAKIWDATSGALIRDVSWGPPPKAGKPCSFCSDYSLENITMSPDGRWLAATLYGDETGTVKIWDVDTGNQAGSLTTGAGARASGDALPTRAANHMLFTPDSRSLVVGSFDTKIKQWIKVFDVESRKLRNAFLLEEKAGLGEAHNYQFALSPDGRTIAVQYVLYGRGGSLETTDTIATIDLASGRMLRTFLADKIDNNANLIQYSPDGRLIFVGNYNSNVVVVWDADTGLLVRRLEDNPGSPWSIAFSPDQRRFIVGNMNGTAGSWDMQTFERLSITLHVGSGEWVTITPEGFFTASEHGAELLHVVRGFETIGIDQVYQSLYRPDLVREKLAGDPRGQVREAAATLDLNKVIASGSAPDLHLTLPGRSLGSATVDSNSILVEAEIIDRGGGVGRVEWRANGVTAGIDTPAPASVGVPLSLTRSLALDPGDNTIEVVAYNRANLIASVPARVSVTSQAGAPAIVPSQPTAPAVAPEQAPVAVAKPRLFMVVAGVDDYADKRFKLSYAVSDAKDIARGFQDSAGNLYQSAEIKLMTDAEVTKEKLDAAFAEMAAKASASDVFVLYLAGHGKTVDGRYYFVPQDFAIDGELTEKVIDAAVKTKAIAQDQWQRWFASIPARKSVILFDTCDSGTLAGDETQQLEKGAANNRLSQATGRSILAASGGSQEALEGYHGHGLFTYEILDAINQADGDRNGTIELNELAAYVYSQVSELSQQVFKQRQVPEMKITANYPLTRQTRILQDEVTPVAEAKPTYQVAQAAQLQVQPSSGATVVRSLLAKTPVTVLESRNGWSLIASGGTPIGYVATRDLALMP